MVADDPLIDFTKWERGRLVMTRRVGSKKVQDIVGKCPICGRNGVLTGDRWVHTATVRGKAKSLLRISLQEVDYCPAIVVAPLLGD